MSTEIYEVPDSVECIFEDVKAGDGDFSYRIINYTKSMDMDNIASMQHFIEVVDINDEYIVEDLGTQITLSHPDYDKRIVIDSGGLGDFYSHGFDCYWHEEDEEVNA